MHLSSMSAAEYRLLLSESVAQAHAPWGCVSVATCSHDMSLPVRSPVFLVMLATDEEIEEPLPAFGALEH